MREIRECTAEVFRRSEKRIKDRKRNRNRMLVLCIPACLLVTALSVMILPVMMPAVPAQDDPIDLFFSLEDSADGMAEDADREDSMADTVGSADESFASPYTAVEVQGGDSDVADFEKVTDQAMIANLYDTIQSFFAEADGMGQSSEEALDVEEDEKADSSCVRRAYTILFTAKDGSRAVYRLNGNTLLNGETGEKVILNDAQVVELLAVFGDIGVSRKGPEQ